MMDTDIYKDVQLEFGLLFQCKRKYDGSLFAVKMILKSQLTQISGSNAETEQVIIKAIKHEIDTLQHLNHKYIVNIHEIYETESTLYIIIDECVGGQLYTKLSEQRTINEYQSKMIIKQICTALHYMDDQHLIIHCDLNINNIYFVNESLNHVKISNFCMSQILPYLPSDISSKQMVTSCTAPECIQHVSVSEPERSEASNPRLRGVH